MMVLPVLYIAKNTGIHSLSLFFLENGILYVHMYAIFNPLFRNTFHPEDAQGYRLI
jgi:hypothetical protein